MRDLVRVLIAIAVLGLQILSGVVTPIVYFVTYIITIWKGPSKNWKFVINNAIAVDLHINANCGGSPRETISSRIGRTYMTDKMANMVKKLLDWIDDNHCIKNIEIEEHQKDAVL